MYTVNQNYLKHTGKVIGIFEYLDKKKNKWLKPKISIGTEDTPITDEVLTNFIDEYSPEEVCFLVKDRTGEYHHIDFPSDELKK